VEREWGLLAILGSIVLYVLFTLAIDVGRGATDVDAAYDTRLARDGEE